ncbi:SirB2 family protein [Vibrio sp. RC27]
MYLVVKNFHMVSVTISVLLLCFRFALMLFDSPLLQRKWLKVVPHIIDTLLLASGLYLIHLTRFIPFTAAAPWLTEKLVCVVVYIILGAFALKYGQNKTVRTFAFIGALGWIATAGYLAVVKLPIFIQ